MFLFWRKAAQKPQVNKGEKKGLKSVKIKKEYALQPLLKYDGASCSKGGQSS